MAQKELEKYHLAWLQSHPWVSEQWLRDKLKEGFHIHHIDCNHFNNDPRNLLLIYGPDHLAFHAGGLPRPPGFSKGKPKPRKMNRLTIGRKILDVFSIYKSWEEMGAPFGITGVQARRYANEVAKSLGRPTLRVQAAHHVLRMRQRIGAGKGQIDDAS